MQVKISQAVRMITAAIKARVVPMLMGSPGIGKSQIIYQIAETYNLKVIDIRLSQCDPTDLAGFPEIINGKADYAPMAHFPIEGDPLPTGYSGWLLFLDEATSAPPAIQAASYKLVLDRMIGTKKLHKNCAMVLAGNMESDGAIVHSMSTALQSRLLHLELVVDQAEWLDWASLHIKSHRIPDYIKFKPGMIYTFSPDHTDHTYACPRTWEFADRLLGVLDEDSEDMLPTLAGTISEGVAREFLFFCQIYSSLPKIEEIVANPEKIKVPSEPSVMFALTGSVSHNIKDDNASQLMKFIARLPDEFQVVCMREARRKNKNIVKHPAVMAWNAKRAVELF
jgi:AAA domain (dynein-related subfamily)